ncbi:MAG: hypothetical protein NT028_07980, partial [candidate division Zixibacteria bacterium]|nr:hypothetical protein [candidate division Zixibacteria bacterium]
ILLNKDVPVCFSTNTKFIQKNLRYAWLYRLPFRTTGNIACLVGVGKTFSRETGTGSDGNAMWAEAAKSLLILLGANCMLRPTKKFR